MTFIDLTTCSACAQAVGHWAPPERMCPTCRALAFPDLAEEPT